MSALAPGVRDRSFRTVLRGYDPASVRAALDAAAAAFEALEADIARLREQQAGMLREMDRMGELERSLLRSCVAAEEDARVRCGAARRYATRVIAAAEEQAAASLEAPTRERDRIAREIEVVVGRRREAAATLEGLIAGLQRPPEAESDPIPASSDEVESEAPTVVFNPRAVEDGTRATLKRERPETKPHPLAMDAVERRPQQLAAVRPATPGRPDDQQVSATTDGPGGRRLRVSLAAGAAAALLLILQGSAVVPRVSSTPSALAAASFAPASAEAQVPPGNQEISSNTGSSAPATNAPAPAALTIHIKPLRTCWVRVVVDGRTDAREIEPGEDIVLKAQRSIVLRAGDAGALSIEVNGRVLPPLGLDGQVVERRFTAAE